MGLGEVRNCQVTRSKLRKKRRIFYNFEIAAQEVLPSDWVEVQMANTTSRSPTARYDANYGEFQTELYAEIRREAFDEDIGQTVGLHRTSTTGFWNGLTLSLIHI